MGSMNFFKRMYIAIFKVDKYNEFIEEKKRISIIYMGILLLAVCLILTMVSYVTKDSPYSVLQMEELKDFDISTIYVALFFALCISTLVTTSIYICIIALFGHLIKKMLNIPLKLDAIISISVYSYTLSIVINLVASVAYSFTGFKFAYFDEIYLILPFIYLIAALLIIRQNIIKPDNIVAQSTRTVTVADLRKQEEKEEQESEEDLKRREEEQKKERKKRREQERKRRLKPKDPLEDREPDGSEI